MKILHVITLSELGGAQSVLLNLAISAMADGHEVMVASSEGGDLWKELPVKVQKKVVPSLKREIHLSLDWKVVGELKKINAEFKPDVVHLHSSKIGMLGRIAFPSRKIVYTVHGFDSIRLAFRKFLYLEKLMQYRTRFIVAVSKYDFDNLKSEGISRNVQYIYNGISDYPQQVSLALPDSALINAKDILQKDDAFKVLSIARLAPPKRFDLFCEIARQFNSNDVHFYWVGNKVPVENLPENVFCLGEVPNAHQLLPFSNLFTLCSDYEGMPMSILEALSYGVPVVASNVGGISEVLNSKNGFSVENQSILFAAEIEKFRTNYEFYNTAQIEARESYLSNFTVSRMYQYYLKLYNQISSKN